MVTYTHDYKSITDESVVCEKDYIGGADKNYAKTRVPITGIVKVMQAGVDITAQASIEDLGGAIGEVITFGTPSTVSGLVVVDYTYSGGTINQEGVDVIRYNIGGTPNNSLTVQNFPIRDGSVTIEDGEGTDVTSYLTGIEGNGREILRVGDLLSDTKYLVSYQYDAGEAGSIWVDNYNYLNDISSLESYIDDSDGKYEERLTDFNSEREVSRKNYRLYLMRLILDILENEIETFETYWNIIRTSAPDWTTYQELYSKVVQLSYLFINSNLCNKIQTYLAELGEVDMVPLTITFDGDASKTRRFDYDGISNPVNLTPAEKAKFTSGHELIADAYSETVDYSLRLALDNNKYITSIELYTVPDEDTNKDIDNVNFSLSTAQIPPQDLLNDSDFDKQVNNASYKNIIDIDTNKEQWRVFIKEPLRDENGAPVDRDAEGNKFEHRVLTPRKYLLLFKKSVMVNNYIAEIKLYRASDDTGSVTSNISSINTAADTFVTNYNTPLERIHAWRGDTDYSIVNLTGLVDPNPPDCSSTFDSRCPAGGLKNQAWIYVRNEIDALFNQLGDLNALKAAWNTELTTEGVPTTQKEIDRGYGIWKEKYEDASQSYVAILNSKNKKTVEKIFKEQVIDEFTPLPPIT